MQPRHALVAQLVALSSIFAIAELGGCAAGTTDTPTGPVASASDTGTGASTSTHAAASTATSGSPTSAASTSSAGGAGSVASSTSTATSTASVTSTSTSTSSGAGGCGTVYGHTITIDGSNDFAVSEPFATTSNNYTGYVTWDASNVYVGMKGADVMSGDPNKWVLVYLGGTAGTTAGVVYNGQQPALPFAAKYHLRWKADNTYTNAEVWSGTSWVDAAWSFTGKVYQQGDYLEMAIARADIGSPTTTLDIHLSMINEMGGVESTYAGVPSTSFVDGFDKDATHYFKFDLSGCAAPIDYMPL